MIRHRTAASLVLFVCLATGASAAAQSAHKGGSGLAQRASASRVKGEMNAPVLVYEVADFQCPYCAQFAPVHARLDSAFVQTGKVQWVFVNLPLPLHANAWAAAEAAMCAGAVARRFWEMHDRLFRTQQEWSKVPDPAPILARYAREAGVPAEAYNACVASDGVAGVVLEDVMFATRAAVNGTPSFIINGDQRVVGVKSFEEWKELIEHALKRPR